MKMIRPVYLLWYSGAQTKHININQHLSKLFIQSLRKVEFKNQQLPGIRILFLKLEYVLIEILMRIFNSYLKLNCLQCFMTRL